MLLCDDLGENGVCFEVTPGYGQGHRVTLKIGTGAEIFVLTKTRKCSTG